MKMTGRLVAVSEDTEYLAGRVEAINTANMTLSRPRARSLMTRYPDLGRVMNVMRGEQAGARDMSRDDARDGCLKTRKEE